MMICNYLQQRTDDIFRRIFVGTLRVNMLCYLSLYDKLFPSYFLCQSHADEGLAAVMRQVWHFVPFEVLVLYKVKHTQVQFS